MYFAHDERRAQAASFLVQAFVVHVELRWLAARSLKLAAHSFNKRAAELSAAL
jgi:hypothetical protein